MINNTKFSKIEYIIMKAYTIAIFIIGNNLFSCRTLNLGSHIGLWVSQLVPVIDVLYKF